MACVGCLLPVLAQDYVAPARKLQAALFVTNSLYVDSVDNQKMTDEALKAMIKTLDPHSAYMSKEEMNEMNEPLQGGFDGIGISFNMMNDTLFVVEVITGGPSEKVGMLAGDRILTIDDEVVAGVKMSNKNIMSRLKGKKGTVVRVGVKRRGHREPIEFRIVRDKIPLYSIDASFMLDKKTGYIRLSRFSATTMEEYQAAFSKLTEQGMKQLILDLQSNGGGYMKTAIDLADEFLDEGKCIVYTEGLHAPKTQADATKKGAFENGNLVILIDEYSASSSEILSGAVQDWDRGLIVGRRSFGKGLVQRILPFGDGTSIKLTVARYYTPSGRCIQKPYEGGDNEVYARDLIERYNRGEMLSADSIHFPDSLRYSTLLKARNVYGGGGIMPDVFVPIDTARYTEWHKQLIYKGILNRFTLRYADDHRQELLASYPNADKFIDKFEINEQMMTQLMDMSAGEQVRISRKDSLSDMRLLKLQCKAYIARDLFKSSDYYKVMAPENEILQEALRILNDKKLRLQYGLQ